MSKQYNPYQNMLDVLNAAAARMGLKEEEYSFLLEPERALIVSLPVKMDDGSVEVFEGYRVQHSTVLGPAKGGIRYHQNSNLDEVKALAGWMSIKCAVAGIPYGGGKGAIKVDPQQLSQDELERLTRAYARAIAPIIGAHKDVPAPDVNTNAVIMNWFRDEYEKVVGHPELAVVTGKPVGKGGSLGRAAATGYGILLVGKEVLRCEGKQLAGMSVVVQGCGNVGSVAAKCYYENGAVIKGVSDYTGAIFNDNGLDMNSIYAYVEKRNLLKDYPLQPGDYFVEGQQGNEQLLTADVDILIPAALENQITEVNADQIKAKYVFEGANGPTTTEADEILYNKGIVVSPDVLTNSGGVTVSYFEWVQNLDNNYWSEEEVNKKLENIIVPATTEIYDMAHQYNCSLRNAAYMMAIKRILDKHNY